MGRSPDRRQRRCRPDGFERIERRCRDGPDTGVSLMLRGPDNFLVGVFPFTEFAILKGFGGRGITIIASGHDELE